ncbi:MAG: class I SAM-dependent methyltransferase [Cyanobacteria bacterium J06600_6]
MNLRSQRERESVDQTDIYQNSEQWHQNFAHVFQCPNTLRHEATLKELLSLHVPGKRVLDIGCGYGGSSIDLLEQQASYVHGIDISERFIASAKNFAQPQRLDFNLHDISQPIAGKYDVVFGRSILHHLDYQEVLSRLYTDNLNPNGIMIFMEPLGSNLLLRLYWQVAKNAHTPDERPFMRQDLNWLSHQFKQFTLIPINYFSLVFGIISSKLLSRPDNLVLKLSDILDTKLATISYLRPNYRQAIFVINK